MKGVNYYYLEILVMFVRSTFFDELYTGFCHVNSATKVDATIWISGQDT